MKNNWFRVSEVNPRDHFLRPAVFRREENPNCIGVHLPRQEKSETISFQPRSIGTVQRIDKISLRMFHLEWPEVRNKETKCLGDSIALWIAFLLLAQQPPGSILGVPNFFQKFDSARFIYSALLREWTVKSLIVDWTHLALASSKLQKSNKGSKLAFMCFNCMNPKTRLKLRIHFWLNCQ